ncbi:MAG: hypothetical protein ACRCYU_12190 [Nocardioides sp.]
MSTKARRAEAQETGAAFQIALTAIGVGAIEEALDLWEDVNPNRAASTGARWLSRATELVMSRHGLSGRLAFAYFRLVRALFTGRTIADPSSSDEQPPTLGDLRREFRELLSEVQATSAPARSEQARRTEERFPDAEPDDDPLVAREGDDEVLEVDELEQILDLEEELDRLAREETVTTLEALGSKGIERRLERGPKSLTPEQAHAESGARQAAAASRLAMNGGRSTLWAVAGQDRRVIGWVRVSRTGTPCGFCAMLLSRGAVYRSKESATSYEDGDLYHDNCNCYAEPIYTPAQYADSRFDLNREYAELWPKVTKGKSGKDALSEWRRFIRKRNADDAQEASPRAA